MLIVKDKPRYWDIVLEGLGDKMAMTAVLIWLVVGIYGSILKSGHLVEGLVWLSVKLHLSGAGFCVATFLFSATFALATGRCLRHRGSHELHPVSGRYPDGL